MPTKRRRPRSTDKRLALDKRLREIRVQIAKLERDRAAVKRDEFTELSKSLQQLQTNTADLATQLMRIAQIQAEVDVIKRALKKARLLD
jgi:septal ring factor EnvC (AmiA/AmiB activator)